MMVKLRSSLQLPISCDDDTLSDIIALIIGVISQLVILAQLWGQYRQLHEAT